jgi:hypothetical protein
MEDNNILVSKEYFLDDFTIPLFLVAADEFDCV